MLDRIVKGERSIYWWIMYDITTAKGLRRITKLCRQNGLHRVQKSIYLGDLTPEQTVKMQENILSWISPAEDRFMMLPITQRCMDAAITLGQNITFEELLETKDVVFL